MSRLISSAAFAFLLSACSSIGRDPLFRLTLKVVDDEGTPVAGAKARIGAERRSKPEESEGKGVFDEGVTDEKGIFSGEVEAWDATRAGYRVEKEGYYGVWLSYSARSHTRGKWQPWNPTIEVVLKRIKNPVPMYARRVETKIPEFDKPIGFDLVRSDWVAPYGNGQESDFIFLVRRDVKSDREYDGSLTIRFARQGDGLRPLEIPLPETTGLRMPYQAPEEGYLSETIWRKSRGKDASGQERVSSSESKTMNYFIRVRTRRDAEGRVTSAYYGKIHGDIRWFIGTQAPKSGLAFTYYLNPDGTRNIEYDPKRNLLKPPKRGDPAYENLAP